MALLYGDTFEPKISKDEACRMALPYYPWELDCDYTPKDTDYPFSRSPLFDSNIWGSYKQSSEVTDGVFADPSWVLNANTSLDNGNFQSNKAPGWSNRLKRCFDVVTFPLQYGPSQIGDQIVAAPDYYTYARWVENGPHSGCHLLFGYSMKSMYSPDEPTFFLHHCNIDRIYHLWADCQGYDLLDKDQITNIQYNASNPLSVQKDAKPKYNPLTTTSVNPTGDPYSVELNDKIFYYWQSKTESKVFPQTEWPTYKDMWGMGNSDSDRSFGMWYRYGTDTSICATTAMQKNCPDKVWRWVNQPDLTKKRSVEQQEVHPVVHRINEQYKQKVYRGLTAREALRELAMEECEQIPKQQVTKDLLMFIEMNGGNLAEYDRICDKVDNAITEKKDDKPAEQATTDTTEIQTAQMNTPVWVIVVASVGSIIGFIIIVVIVVYIVKKRREAAQANLYVEM